MQGPILVLLDIWRISAMFAGCYFFIRSYHRIPRVGVLQYMMVLVVCSIAWPFFLRRGYF